MKNCSIHFLLAKPYQVKQTRTIFGWFPSSCLGTLSLQAPACSLTVPRESWSFKDRIPKQELGNEQNLMNDNELLIAKTHQVKQA